MPSQVKKVIYTDNEHDVAITGIITAEDEFFITIEHISGRIYKIGKKSIVCIKECDHQ